MCCVAPAENKPLVGILAKPSDVRIGCPQHDTDQVFDFDVAVELLNKRNIDLIGLGPNSFIASDDNGQ